MASLTTAQYDALERAVTDGRRVAVRRPGGYELVIVPEALRLVRGRECIETTHPGTGFPLTLWIDELDGFEVVR